MSLDSKGGGSMWGWGNTELVQVDFINMGGPSRDIGYKTLASILRGVNPVALRSLAPTK